MLSDEHLKSILESPDYGDIELLVAEVRKLKTLLLAILTKVKEVHKH